MPSLYLTMGAVLAGIFIAILRPYLKSIGLYALRALLWFIVSSNDIMDRLHTAQARNDNPDY